MNAADILEHARTLGVSLRIEGGTVKAKGPRPAVEQLLPALREHKPELLVALTEPHRDPAETSGHWLIVQPTDRAERWFTPPVTRGELAQRYPRAALIALPDTTEPQDQLARQATYADLEEMAQEVRVGEAKKIGRTDRRGNDGESN